MGEGMCATGTEPNNLTVRVAASLPPLGQRTHFLSLASNCEGMGTEMVVGYVRSVALPGSMGFIVEGAQGHVMP